MSGTDKQKPKEKALRENEARYRELVENASVWIWEIDRNLRHVYTNQFVAACLGYQPNEFLAADIFTLVHPEDHGTVKELVCRATTERKGWSGAVLRWRHKDGSWRHIESSGAAIFDENGNLLGLRGVDRDITERKNALDALRESEERFRSIVDGTMDGIALADATNGKFILGNKALCAMLSCTEDTLLTMRLDDIHPADAMPRVRKHLEETTRGETSMVHDIPVKRRDGSVFYADISASTMKFGEMTHFIGVFRDITERKKASEEQQKLASIIETSPDFIGIADLEGRLLYLNTAGQNLVGIDDIKDVQHRHVGQFHLESDRRRFEAEILPSILQTGRWSGEIAYRHFKTGVPVPVEMDAFMIRDGKTGQPIALANISRDITERKRAEEALRESETKFRKLAETIKEVFWLGAPDWSRIYYISPSYELVWGRACDELFRNSMLWLESVVEEDRKALMEIIPDSGFTWRGELRFPDYRIVRPDRTIRWISARAYPIRDADDKVTGVAGIAEDITERKKAEETLRESQARLDLALQSARMGVWRFDIIGNRRYFDKQVCHILGLNPVTFSGSAEEFFGAIHPDDREFVRAALARTIEQDMPYEPEYRTVWPDGTIHYVTARGRLVRDDAGRPIRINGIIWDITERKKTDAEKLDLERQLMQAHRLESLGVLAGGIAHDFNNLLQGIFGYISMAKMSVDQREKALAMLEQSEEALHQTVSLTTQLLTFSKGGRPVRKSIRLMPVIENIVKFSLSGSRTDYKIDADADLWTVEADEGQIGQVIQNLVINADQSMPMGGRIVIKARNMQAPGAQIPVDLAAGDYVEISFQDNGIGIPKEYLESIFDPYFTTKEKGSGLGLAISYSIIRNHGGTIRVASEVGRGSIFSVYLPAVAEASAVLSSSEATGPTRKGRILLMDDASLVRDIATEMIRALGHEVDCSAHGEECVTKYLQARQQGAPFDVVILDLTIRGGMGGAETVRRLQEIDPQVKAVVSSGYSEDSVVADYRSYGFCDSLSKPYDIKALRNTLDALLAS